MSGRAFRAQLVTQGQRELFDTWRLSAGLRTMPARSDFNPLSVPRLLPHIGLIDVRQGLAEACFKLAGTRLYDVYGEEITGKRIENVFSGSQREYWGRIHNRVVERGLPAHGVVRGPIAARDHIIMFWLRLPLSGDGLVVDTILCLDFAVPGQSDTLCRKESPLVPYPVMRARSRAQAQRAQCV